MWGTLNSDSARLTEARVESVHFGRREPGLAARAVIVRLSDDLSRTEPHNSARGALIRAIRPGVH